MKTSAKPEPKFSIHASVVLTTDRTHSWLVLERRFDEQSKDWLYRISDPFSREKVVAEDLLKEPVRK